MSRELENFGFGFVQPDGASRNEQLAHCRQEEIVKYELPIQGAA